MRLSTLFALLGLLVSAFGAFWYWQIMQVAAALAWMGGGPNTNRAAWTAIGLFFFGMVVFVICIVINFVAKDPDE